MKTKRKSLVFGPSEPLVMGSFTSDESDGGRKGKLPEGQAWDGGKCTGRTADLQGYVTPYAPGLLDLGQTSLWTVAGVSPHLPLPQLRLFGGPAHGRPPHSAAVDAG